MINVRVAATLAALSLAVAPLSAADRKTGKLDVAVPEGPARLNMMPGETTTLFRGVQLYVPADIDAGERVPLLVLMPGTKGSGENMVETLKGAADRYNFALLGITPRKDNFTAVDNFFDDRDKGLPHAIEDWPAPRFGKDIDRLEASLARAFDLAPIDPERIGLFGFSHGGSFALMVGTANPELFSTIAALSPGILVIPRDQHGGQSIFLSHGQRDQVLPHKRTACAMRPRLSSFGNGVEMHSFDGGHEIPMEITAEALEHFLAGREGRELLDPLPEPAC